LFGVIGIAEVVISTIESEIDWRHLGLGILFVITAAFSLKKYIGERGAAA
jgi:hypothetical protein